MITVFFYRNPIQQHLKIYIFFFAAVLLCLPALSQKPIISSFSPDTAGVGMTVTIKGINFINTSSISFGGVNVVFFDVLSDTALAARVENGASGNVVVTNSAGTGTLGGFTFIPPPQLSSFTPQNAAPATSITINGNNFVNVTSVTIAGTEVPYTVNSSNKITTVAPVAKGGGRVIVTTLYGQDTLGGFYNGVIVKSFSPITGPVGTTVTVNGTNFNTDALKNIVYFGAVKAKVLSATSTSLSVQVPNGTTYQPISVTTDALTAYSAQPFNVIFAGGDSAFTANSFTSKLDLIVGNEPYGVSIGDLDGDGMPDLAVAVRYYAQVSVYRNTSIPGAISFAPKVDFATDNNSVSVAIADIDGDGKPDLIVSNSLGLNVTIWRNTSTPGSILFGQKINVPLRTGAENWSISAADVDADGKPDIIVTNVAGPNIVSVYRNKSTPGQVLFEDGVAIETGGPAHNATVKDLNGDGRPDLAVSTTAGLEIFKNTGGAGVISFAKRQDYNVDAKGTVTVCDVDGDGKPDVTVASAGTIGLFKNTSTADTITFATRQDISTGGYLFATAAADINGDGKPDIAGVDGALNLSVLKNNTKGGVSFATGVNYFSGVNPGDLAIGDLDGDSKPDIVTVNGNGNYSSVAVFRNQVSGPVITEFTPLTGGPGTTVTITGSNLSGTTSVNFGGVPSKSFKVISPTTVSAVVANGASGSVTLVSPLGAAGLAGFQYIPPSVDSFSPVSGGPGTAVTITGKNFLGATSVSFGGTPAMSFKIITPYTIIAVVDTGTSGFVNVTTQYGSDSIGGFAYIPLPFVQSFSPTSAGVGDKVKIMGINFAEATSVSFGTIPARSFSISSDSVIIAVVAEGGSGNVIVANAYGPDSLAGFTFTGGVVPAPVIASFKPVSGPAGTAVTIKGSNFKVGNSSNTVYFGAVRATVTGTTDSSITVTAPAGATYQPISIARNNLVAYSAKPFIETFANGDVPVISASFAPEITITTDGDPDRVAVGDFDGDGKIDFAAIVASASVYVYKNLASNGVIAFAKPLKLTPGSGAFDIATADINGDGKLDLVTVNQNASVSVLINTSLGDTISFATPLDFATNGLPNSIAVGDINNDGKPDIVVSSDNYYKTISVLENTSSGRTISFAPKVDYYTGTSNTGVGIADFDGDHNPDIAVNHLTTANISVYRNVSSTKAIDLASPLQFAAGNQPQCLAIGDFDNDGMADIAIGNAAGNSVSLLHNSSVAGSISFDPKIDFACGNGPVDIRAEDINGDGKVDIILADRNYSAVSVLENITAGASISFAPVVNYGVDEQPTGVGVADFSGDGKPDILATNYGGSIGNTISILKNTMGSLLSLNLLNFTASLIKSQTQVKWQTVNEQNTGHFEIERSPNGSSFNIIGKVSAVGNTYTEKSYSFIDAQPLPGVNYYRLKMIDVNGKFTYSSIINITKGDVDDLLVFPNPAKDKVIIKYPTTLSCNIRIIDMQGKTIKTVIQHVNSTETTLDVKGLAAGIYTITWSNGQQIVHKKLVVQ